MAALVSKLSLNAILGFDLLPLDKLVDQNIQKLEASSSKIIKNYGTQYDFQIISKPKSYHIFLEYFGCFLLISYRTIHKSFMSKKVVSFLVMGHQPNL